MNVSLNEEIKQLVNKSFKINICKKYRKFILQDVN